MAHLHQLKIENFKRIEAATIEFTAKGVTEICGRNGAGKSSAIDAIWAALGGAAASPERPIRSGANRGRVSLKLDELEVVREWDARGTRLIVNDALGNKLGRPQEVLDRLYGRLGFDPLAFIRQKPAEQAAMLRRVTGLDFAPLDARRKALYDERTDVNRAIKQQEARLAELPEVEPVEPASAAELQARLQDANRENGEVANARRAVERKQDEIARRQAEIASLGRQIGELQARLAALQGEQAEAEDEKYQLEGFVGEEVDTAAILEQIGQIEETNRKARAHRERAAAAEALRANRAHAEDLTDRMEAIDAERARMLAAAPFPLPGLSIEGEDGGTITYDGVPLAQASTAGQIRISLAISAALNPELRLIVVKEGSLLDDDSLALVAGWAEAHAYQVIVERVGESSRGHGVVIEEGRVRESQPEAVA